MYNMHISCEKVNLHLHFIFSNFVFRDVECAQLKK